MQRTSTFSWILLFAAIAALALAGYAAKTIQAAALARAEEVQTEAQQLDRKAYADRLSAIASDTADERAELEQFLRLDIVATAEEFERIGTLSGVKATVTGALPDPGKELPGGGTLRWISFLISAEGTYAALMRTVALYEDLPYALEISRFDLEQNSETEIDWRLTLSVRVLVITENI